MEDPPQGSCIQQDQNNEMNFYAQDFSYSQKSCMDTYLQVMIIKHLGICWKSHPCNPLNLTTAFGESLRLEPRKLANKTSKQLGQLHEKLMKDFLHFRTFCQPPCSETIYNVIQSSALLTSPNSPENSENHTVITR